MWVTLFLLGAPPALDAVVPAGFTATPSPTVRVGDAWVNVNRAVVDVPVYIGNSGPAEGVYFVLDYDPDVLGYAFYQDASTDWTMERVTPYGDARVTFLLRRVQGSGLPLVPQDEGETRILNAVFFLKSSASADQQFFVRTTVAPGVQTSIKEAGDSFFFVDNGGSSFRAIPTRLVPGQVTVYYQDGVELGWGALTQTAQEFTLPVYVTAQSSAQKLFLVGVDYDELFLGVRSVDGVGPTIQDKPSSTLEWVRFPVGPPEDPSETDEGVRFQVEIQSTFAGPICHLHVADLHFEYNGQLTNLEELEIYPSLLRLAPAAGKGGAGDADLDGGGGSYGSALEGVVKFLPPHFVRGNVDSSVARSAEGVNPAPNISDAQLILGAIFLGSTTMPCEDAADVNDNGIVELTDVILLLNHIFRGGQPPAAPYPSAGLDHHAEDSLDCELSLPVFVPLSAR